MISNKEFTLNDTLTLKEKFNSQMGNKKEQDLVLFDLTQTVARLNKKTILEEEDIAILNCATNILHHATAFHENLYESPSNSDDFFNQWQHSFQKTQLAQAIIAVADNLQKRHEKQNQRAMNPHHQQSSAPLAKEITPDLVFIERAEIFKTLYNDILPKLYSKRKELENLNNGFKSDISSQQYDEFKLNSPEHNKLKTELNNLEEENTRLLKSLQTLENQSFDYEGKTYTLLELEAKISELEKENGYNASNHIRLNNSYIIKAMQEKITPTLKTIQEMNKFLSDNENKIEKLKTKLNPYNYIQSYQKKVDTTKKSIEQLEEQFAYLLFEKDTEVEKSLTDGDLSKKAENCRKQAYKLQENSEEDMTIGEISMLCLGFGVIMVAPMFIEASIVTAITISVVGAALVFGTSMLAETRCATQAEEAKLLLREGKKLDLGYDHDRSR